MRSPFLAGAACAVVGALTLWSCGGGGTTPTAPSTSPPTSGPSTVTVSIVGSVGNAALRPNPVSAKAGDTVVFRNNDTTMHHITLDDGSADLGDVNPGSASKSFTVRSSSATTYHCTIHSSMVGSINGATAPEPPPCLDPYGYGC
jgi:plastocyanin